MLNKKQLAEEEDFVGTLKMLAQAYEEVAVIKMQRVRSAVLANREFVAEVSEVFSDLRTSYRKEIEEVLRKNKNKKNNKYFQSLTTLNKNGKTVSVFLSANDQLYGDIVKKVFRLFLSEITTDKEKTNPSDIIIIGKSGRSQFEGAHTGRAYTYMEIPDNNVKPEHLKPIVDKVIQYQKINVYYGKFINVMTQDATYNDISGEQPFSEQKEGKEKLKFFFEPSLEQIMQFFESQVFTSFFSQTVHETELARLASRIKSMEEALGNIEKSEGQLKGEARRLKRSLNNKKQLEGLTGIAMKK